MSAIPEDLSLSTKAISFTHHVTDLGAVVRISFDLRSHRASVDAAGAAEHVDSIRDGLWACVGAEVASPQADSALPAWWPWAFGGFVALVTVVAGALRLPPWLRNRRWRSRQAFGRGEVPANAIEVPSRDAASTELRRRTCSCGAPLVSSSAPVSSAIRLGDRTVTSLSAECACGRITKRYYLITP